MVSGSQQYIDTVFLAPLEAELLLLVRKYSMINVMPSLSREENSTSFTLCYCSGPCKSLSLS